MSIDQSFEDGSPTTYHVLRPNLKFTNNEYSANNAASSYLLEFDAMDSSDDFAVSRLEFHHEMLLSNNFATMINIISQSSNTSKFDVESDLIDPTLSMLNVDIVGNAVTGSIVYGENIGDVDSTVIINSNSADYLFNVAQSGTFICENCQIDDNSNSNSAMTSMFALTGSTGVLFNASNITNSKHKMCWI